MVNNATMNPFVTFFSLFCFAMFTYFVIGEDFFGVLYSLLGVLGLETGVVLGAMFIFFGVAMRLGDGDDLAADDVLGLNCMRKKNKITN